MAWLAILVVVASVCGAFYDLRSVYYMYFGEEVEGVETNRSPILLVFFVVGADLMVVSTLITMVVEGAAEAAAATLVT